MWKKFFVAVFLLLIFISRSTPIYNWIIFPNFRFITLRFDKALAVVLPSNNGRYEFAWDYGNVCILKMDHKFFVQRINSSHLHFKCSWFSMLIWFQKTMKPCINKFQLIVVLKFGALTNLIIRTAEYDFAYNKLLFCSI